MSGPIFLAGLDRSGIGLVGELLDAHPEVAITRRTNFWSFYADRYGDLADPARFERCLTDMLAYTRIGRLQPDVDRLRADFMAGERSYPQLLRLLEEQNMERHGKKRWGDKSLGAERHADRILAAYPDAVMVHVIRDPRDRYASQATHRSAGRGGVGAGTAAWLWSIGQARRHQALYPDRYLVLRYEDLVADPSSTLVDLCRFVGVEFTPEMLATEDGRRLLHSGSIGRHRGDLTAAEVAFIERHAAEEMARWGYAAAGSERRGAWRMPRATAGLLLWGPRSKLGERFGARPSVRRTVC